MDELSGSFVVGDWRFPPQNGATLPDGATGIAPSTGEFQVNCRS